MKAKLSLDHQFIYTIDTYVEPRSAKITIQLTDKDSKPVPGAYLLWSCDKGKISDVSEARTDNFGGAFALFLSDAVGECNVTVKASKEGFEPCEASTKIDVVKSNVTLEIVNKPPIGKIFVNDECIGTAKANQMILKPGIFRISWEEMAGYVCPEPAKVYVNPNYSVAPVVVEGVYRKADEKQDSVKLTVFVVITFDEQTGIPNPIPLAQVVLGDGQVGITDLSGKAEFNVKANGGLLKVKAIHPDVYGTENEVEVDVGNRDMTVNVDFGFWAGGEESIDVSRSDEEEGPVSVKDYEER